MDGNRYMNLIQCYVIQKYKKNHSALPIFFVNCAKLTKKKLTTYVPYTVLIQDTK